FGYSVGISGDTVVIGALGEDSNATGVNGNQSDNNASGAAATYVFVRSGASWMQTDSQTANTTASDDDSNDHFRSYEGIVVVEVGNDTGVNGNQSDNSASAAGAAYVFVRSGTTWSQQAYRKASSTDAGDGFGISVRISGETVVVGADGEDSNATGVNGNQSDN